MFYCLSFFCRNKAGPQKRAKLKGKKGNNTQFTVTGVANVKQRLGKSKVTDARQRIQQSTKFVDARARIELKKAQTQVVDVRNKIENAKARKMDARQMLRARQQKQNQSPAQPQQPSGNQPQFMVTGLGRVAINTGQQVQSVQPPLTSANMKASGLTRTISGSRQIPARVTPRTSISASAIAGNIVRTVGEFYLP